MLGADGEKLSSSRIDNDPLTLRAEIERLGSDVEVAMEATWGLYWVADVITAAGATLHLVHPLEIRGFENRRVKNDDETSPRWPSCCGWVDSRNRG